MKYMFLILVFVSVFTNAQVVVNAKTKVVVPNVGVINGTHISDSIKIATQKALECKCEVSHESKGIFDGRVKTSSSTSLSSVSSSSVSSIVVVPSSSSSSSSSSTNATVIGAANFNNGVKGGSQILAGTAWYAWGGGTSEVVDGAMHFIYPSTQGGIYGPTLEFKFENTTGIQNDVCVQFRAKMPNNKNGMKFVKVFGKEVIEHQTANVTFGLDYVAMLDYPLRGSMYAVSFGDGTDVENDTANFITLDGYAAGAGRSYPNYLRVNTPVGDYFKSSNWGTDWHTFKLRVKYNSGTTRANEKADGLFYIEIDGRTYLDATGVFNRHPSNPEGIKSINFGDWSQGSGGAFDWYLDDVVITKDGCL